MKLYDDCITRLKAFLGEFAPLSPDMPEAPWPDGGSNQLIFQSDTACELGGGGKPGLSGTLLTQSGDVRDQVLLLGADLPQLRGDAPYARVSIVRVNPQSLGQGEALYKAVRRLEYTRYHVSPEGYMPRISVRNHRENVRVSKNALSRGLTFGNVGKCYCDAYHAHPEVQAVTTVFITHPDFPYRELERLLDHAEDITKALDHLVKDMKMDCHVCSLRTVCEEVEAKLQSDFQ